MAGVMRLGAAVAVAGVPAVGLALGRCAWDGIETMTLGSLTPDRAVATAVALAGLVAATYLTVTAVPLVIRRGSTRAPRIWRWLVAVALGLGATTVGATVATAVSPQWGGEPEPGSTASPASSAPPASETMGFESPDPWSPDPYPVEWGANVDTPVSTPLVSPIPLFPTPMSAPSPSIASPSPTPPSTPSASIPQISLTPPPPTIDTAPHSLSSAPAGTHVVVRGDSLWRIAKALLPPNASDAEITRTWQSIYWLNRSTIGSDPGLIFPGQILTIPADVAS